MELSCCSESDVLMLEWCPKFWYMTFILASEVIDPKTCKCDIWYSPWLKNEEGVINSSVIWIFFLLHVEQAQFFWSCLTCFMRERKNRYLLHETRFIMCLDYQNTGYWQNFNLSLTQTWNWPVIFSCSGQINLSRVYSWIYILQYMLVQLKITLSIAEHTLIHVQLYPGLWENIRNGVLY